MGTLAIEGEQLSSVVFLMDYLQLTFNSAWLTLYIWPEVFRAEASYAFGEPGYRDVLCEQITKIVSTATIQNGVALEIQFENSVIFRMSLRDEDYTGPEALNFSNGVPRGPLLVI